ncbi:ATP-binding protein [Vulcanisaeta sp. JCM 14467]|uniref:ATP-binding protein n=1 Tax=Vulcanisaeta sp. JCM 14467 TaxID=1295370 RepID=UPI0006D08836|nr:ATP-binding protein [Vulcanisaeta sp. JCM 14467]
MEKIKLRLTRGIYVEFADREQALKRIEYWANHGMSVVHVIYGPEGCGKTAWLKQSAELLRELGFEVIYMNPIEKEFMAEVGIEDVKKRLLEILREATSESWVKAAWALIDLTRELIKAGRRRTAVLADDVFQAIGLDKAAIYVKGLLGILEYPPGDYDVAITIAATSEGISKREIGRHRWAYLDAMWNMTKEGFKQLYEQLPGPKPDFDGAWRLTGGNPKLLAQLHEVHWDTNELINELIRGRGLINLVRSLSDDERELLTKAVEDPDVLMSRDGIPLLNRLIELNLIVDNIYPRDKNLWIDQPPPERDPELGIGKFVAWQTPIHKEAVRKALTSD